MHRMLCYHLLKWSKSSVSFTRNVSSAAGRKHSNPRRAFMYVPASQEKMIKKAAGLDVDCVVMDCEDAVALSRKEDARNLAARSLDEVDFGRSEYSVRINSIESGFAEADLDVILQANHLPRMLNLPKVLDVGDVEWLADQLKKRLSTRSMSEKLALTLMIESPLGLVNMKDICKRGLELSEKAPFQLEGVIFGYDDFSAEVGVERSPEVSESLVARQMLVIIAKAFHLQAIDVVFTEFKDLEGLRKQCTEAAKMGYTGKQVIHPSQVAVVQECFTPSSERVKWAVELMAAFQKHQESGKGAFIFEGKMIDMPVFLQAQNIVHLKESIEKGKT